MVTRSRPVSVAAATVYLTARHTAAKVRCDSTCSTSHIALAVDFSKDRTGAFYVAPRGARVR